MPPELFTEMTLRVTVVVPPMVLLDAPSRTNTPTPFGSIAVPLELVPIRLQRTTLPVAPAPAISIQLPPRLPEITLPAPATAPPTVLFGAPLSQTFVP